MMVEAELKFRTYNVLRNLILSGFNPDEHSRAEALALYEELIGGENLKRVDLNEYGYPTIFILSLKYGAMADLCREGKKIQAIKMMREETGLGLREAKELVEKMFTFPPLPQY